MEDFVEDEKNVGIGQKKLFFKDCQSRGKVIDG
jgi:hypothetical protein